MSRLTQPLKSLITILVLLQASLGVTINVYAWTPGTPPAAFGIVAKRILASKTCQRPDRILLVRLVDEEAQRISHPEAVSKITTNSVVLIAVDTENWSDETLLFGPVIHVPSQRQLDGLVGKVTCVQ